jgi:phosphate transport system permease protein
MSKSVSSWFKSGAPWVWLSAGAVSISLIMVFGLLFLIAARGLGYFWPADIVELEYREAGNNTVMVVGEIQGRETVSAERARQAGETFADDVEEIERWLLKVGNRDVTGLDFRWVSTQHFGKQSYPENMIAAERREWGNLYGYLQAVKEEGKTVAEGEVAWDALQARLQRATDLFDNIRDIQKGDIGAINYEIEQLRLERRRLELDGIKRAEPYDKLKQRRVELNKEYAVLQKEIELLYKGIARDSMVVSIAGGKTVEVPLEKVVRVYRPNGMDVFDKSLHYLDKLWEFVSDEPREANTEGGIFPAIFGTVLMVIIMSILVTPFGVVAAVYLREYAKQGPVTRIIRIAVNNLAGVPSIVYGVFGLGFFVYFLGGSIDELFYPEAQPAPTFGTPGLLWSSLTLALLTLPVVIVATEEGLARIPRSIREGSLALGATKAETLWRIVLPMASPALMTGMILAVARAAGEVAPLMLVGVVKLAPSLPLDLNEPFLHLDRKFMHLGFHIYDVGFQSPNVEAARPLVYATALLLVVVIVVLNLAAIWIRNHLREKYKALD